MRKGALVAILAVLGSAGFVNAATLNYQVSSSSTVSAYTDGSNGLAIETAMTPNITSGTEAFSLDDGQSQSFELFKIWSDESTINPDDLTSQTITASVVFDVPGTTVTVGGETIGTGVEHTFRGKVSVFGTGANITWDSLPIVVTTSDRVFDLSLNDTSFNSILGLLYVPGEYLAGTVCATVTQVSSVDPGPSGGPTTVPVPASVYGGLALSGLMLLGKRGARRLATA